MKGEKTRRDEKRGREITYTSTDHHDTRKEGEEGRKEGKRVLQSAAH
jgi:hypothetical protein